MTIFWTNNSGQCIKATSDDAEVEGLTPVTVAPESGQQMWNGVKWGPVPPPRPSREQAVDALLKRKSTDTNASKIEKDYVRELR